MPAGRVHTARARHDRLCRVPSPPPRRPELLIPSHRFTTAVGNVHESFCLGRLNVPSCPLGSVHSSRSFLVASSEHHLQRGQYSSQLDLCTPRRRRSWNVKDHPTTTSTELRSRHHSIEETGCSGLPCPGSDRWVDITRNDAVERIRKNIGATRDETWITNESATPTFRSVEGALGKIMAPHNFSARPAEESYKSENRGSRRQP